MKLLTMQFVYFAKESITRPDLLYNELNNKLSNKFDGIPTIINLPEELPSDIPIVQASSLNKMLGLNISRQRVNLFINFDIKNESKPIDLYKIHKSFVEKFSRIVTSSVDVYRIGVVFTLFKIVESNVEAVYSKYLNEKFENGDAEITLRTNKQTLDKGILFNNIRTIEANIVSTDKDNYKGVVVQLDTNNMPYKKIKLNQDTVLDIISYAVRKINDKELKELI